MVNENNKVILILADGMRPDSLPLCGHKSIDKVLDKSRYTMKAEAVMPSVTLPCHMSLFLSVQSERHGILTNTYVPQVRPIKGLCEKLNESGKKCAFFYNWEALRDLTNPGSLSYSNFVSGDVYGYEKANSEVTKNAISYISEDKPDFVFLYLGMPDAVGHRYGWMTNEYLDSVKQSWDCIEDIFASCGDEYTIIITADHGGHDRSHGTDMPEDMKIPVIIYNKDYEKEEIDKDVNIIDIAPTIANMLGVGRDVDWDGKII